MKIKLWLVSLFSVFIILGLIIWPSSVDTHDKAKHDSRQASRQVTRSVAELNLTHAAPLSVRAPETTNKRELVELELKQVAIKHQQTLQYPPYSQPITSKNSPYLNWNAFEAVEVPVLDGKSSATLSVEKYRHFFPEPIRVELTTSQTVIDASLDIVAVDTQQTLAALPIDGMAWQVTPAADWPEELRLVANINFAKGTDTISADIRLYHSVASVVSVSHGYAQGSDMMIPVTLQIDKAGIFRLRANLYQQNGGVIAALVEKKRLSEGEQTVELRAYKQVLPQGASDLELGDFMIERMSGYPGERAGYGQSKAEIFPIGRFDSGSLTDEQYQMTEQEKQQLAFLKQLL
ncbi:hypothetical protein FCU94_08620 [Vibrio sp. JPW-9-11-11]|uniref:hypothetical protein n=1 Tax=Vibrio sp. JPW-9-11-11 TaxID=1416532 RepID=UPI0015935E74|nr:hypothetical protein [Vibrio sp. JPW-9-11-11]NVD06975.1 hypothetical protein [Vibrio sp. JPW-9-11-11]